MSILDLMKVALLIVTVLLGWQVVQAWLSHRRPDVADVHKERLLEWALSAHPEYDAQPNREWMSVTWNGTAFVVNIYGHATVKGELPRIMFAINAAFWWPIIQPRSHAIPDQFELAWIGLWNNFDHSTMDRAVAAAPAHNKEAHEP